MAPTLLPPTPSRNASAGECRRYASRATVRPSISPAASASPRAIRSGSGDSICSLTRIMRSTPQSAPAATVCSSPRRSRPDEMDIRPAHAEDIPQLLALIRRYWDFEGIPGFVALRIELLLKELLGRP